MTYERNITEIKNEYTIFLSNLMVPFIYEGIKSVYMFAVNANNEFVERGKHDPDVKSPGVLKIFQLSLKEIPTLNSNSIEIETNRIKNGSRCADWFDDLVRATIKSNIVLLSFTNPAKCPDIVKQKYHDQIQITDFVHKCYIESARIIYNNPELFWHEFPPLEVKRNQRDACELIKLGIQEAIRKVLPIKEILKEYLANDYDFIEEQNATNEANYATIYTLIQNELSRDRTGQGQPINQPHPGGSILEDDYNPENLGDVKPIIPGGSILESEHSSSSHSDGSSSSNSDTTSDEGSKHGNHDTDKSDSDSSNSFTESNSDSEDNHDNHDNHDNDDNNDYKLELPEDGAVANTGVAGGANSYNDDDNFYQIMQEFKQLDHYQNQNQAHANANAHKPAPNNSINMNMNKHDDQKYIPKVGEIPRAPLDLDLQEMLQRGEFDRPKKLKKNDLKLLAELDSINRKNALNQANTVPIAGELNGGSNGGSNQVPVAAGGQVNNNNNNNNNNQMANIAAIVHAMKTEKMSDRNAQLTHQYLSQLAASNSRGANTNPHHSNRKSEYGGIIENIASEEAGPDRKMFFDKYMK